MAMDQSRQKGGQFKGFLRLRGESYVRYGGVIMRMEEKATMMCSDGQGRQDSDERLKVTKEEMRC